MSGGDLARDRDARLHLARMRLAHARARSRRGSPHVRREAIELHSINAYAHARVRLGGRDVPVSLHFKVQRAFDHRNQSGARQCAPLRSRGGDARLPGEVSRSRLSRCRCCAACGVGSALALSSGFAKPAAANVRKREVSGGSETDDVIRLSKVPPGPCDESNHQHKAAQADQAPPVARPFKHRASSMPPFAAEPIANHEHVAADQASFRRKKGGV
jgi:hypothetical protein